MNKLTRTAFILSVMALLAAPAVAKPGSHAIRGHVTKKGKYVAPSRATNPDKTKRNNYSSKGNTNPSNGKQGTKDPDK